LHGHGEITGAAFDGLDGMAEAIGSFLGHL
jgi:hypothetical protein